MLLQRVLQSCVISHEQCYPGLQGEVVLVAEALPLHNSLQKVLFWVTSVVAQGQRLA